MSVAEVEVSEWLINAAFSEEEIERHLANEGLIRVPAANQQPAVRFTRINVAGKPISETIIEERR